ncbi:MAG: hypothetical protein V8T87_08315 [Victivallales bacterium]
MSTAFRCHGKEVAQAVQGETYGGVQRRKKSIRSSTPFSRRQEGDTEARDPPSRTGRPFRTQWFLRVQIAEREYSLQTESARSCGGIHAMSGDSADAVDGVGTCAQGAAVTQRAVVGFVCRMAVEAIVHGVGIDRSINVGGQSAPLSMP